MWIYLVFDSNYFQTIKNQIVNQKFGEYMDEWLRILTHLICRLIGSLNLSSWLSAIDLHNKQFIVNSWFCWLRTHTGFSLNFILCLCQIVMYESRLKTDIRHIRIVNEVSVKDTAYSRWRLLCINSIVDFIWTQFVVPLSKIKKNDFFVDKCERFHFILGKIIVRQCGGLFSEKILCTRTWQYDVNDKS